MAMYSSCSHFFNRSLCLSVSPFLSLGFFKSMLTCSISLSLSVRCPPAMQLYGNAVHRDGHRCNSTRSNRHDHITIASITTFSRPRRHHRHLHHILHLHRHHHDSSKMSHSGSSAVHDFLPSFRTHPGCRRRAKFPGEALQPKPGTLNL